MPLLDHFHATGTFQYPWDSFHSGWATRIADALNEALPTGFLAAEHTHAGGQLEIDVATFEAWPDAAPPRTNGPPTAVAPRVWAPPAPSFTLPAIFPDSFEVRVFATTGGLTLVGAIELISPANKDRAEERRSFAVQCASYLQQGISLIVVDVVTSRHVNLHNETLRLMEADLRFAMPASVYLYGVAYRPVHRQERPEIDCWTTALAVGSPLPTLPLRLTGDQFIAVDFEISYQETCRRRRLI